MAWIGLEEGMECVMLMDGVCYLLSHTAICYHTPLNALCYHTPLTSANHTPILSRGGRGRSNGVDTIGERNGVCYVNEWTVQFEWMDYEW